MTSPRLTRLAGLDAEAAQMTVARRQPEIVLDGDEIPVLAGIGRRLDGAVRGRVDRLALFGRDVEPLMKRGLAGERIASRRTCR